MGKPAARAGDMHVCPMINGLVPHVGGPVMPPGVPTVLIGGMPAAVSGGMCTCVGPPDIIALGSTGVLIGGQPAARMGDMTAHGGTIILGQMNVLIGETMAGGSGGGGGSAGGGSKLGTTAKVNSLNKGSLANAAANGDGIASRTTKEDLTAQFTLLDEAEKPIKGVAYEIETIDNKKYKGKTDGSGKTQVINGFAPADCRVTFFNN